MGGKMSDWTTKKISEDTEIDLHPDLDSFPACMRTTNPYRENLKGLVLSKQECWNLMQTLVTHFGGEFVQK